MVPIAKCSILVLRLSIYIQIYIIKAESLEVSKKRNAVLMTASTLGMVPKRAAQTLVHLPHQVNLRHLRPCQQLHPPQLEDRDGNWGLIQKSTTEIYTWAKIYYWVGENSWKDATPLKRMSERLSNKLRKKSKKWPKYFLSSPNTHLHHLWPLQNELRVDCSGPGPRTHEHAKFWFCETKIIL